MANDHIVNIRFNLDQPEREFNALVSKMNAAAAKAANIKPPQLPTLPQLPALQQGRGATTDFARQAGLLQAQLQRQVQLVQGISAQAAGRQVREPTTQAFESQLSAAGATPAQIEKLNQVREAERAAVIKATQGVQTQAQLQERLNALIERQVAERAEEARRQRFARPLYREVQQLRNQAGLEGPVDPNLSNNQLRAQRRAFRQAEAKAEQEAVKAQLTAQQVQSEQEVLEAKRREEEAAERSARAEAQAAAQKEAVRRLNPEQRLLRDLNERNARLRTQATGLGIQGFEPQQASRIDVAQLTRENEVLSQRIAEEKRAIRRANNREAEAAEQAALAEERRSQQALTPQQELLRDRNRRNARLRAQAAAFGVEGVDTRDRSLTDLGELERENARLEQQIKEAKRVQLGQETQQNAQRQQLTIAQQAELQIQRSITGEKQRTAIAQSQQNRALAQATAERIVAERLAAKTLQQEVARQARRQGLSRFETAQLRFGSAGVQGLGGGLGAGTFFGGGAIASLRYALPSAAIFGAVQGVRNLVEEGTELELVFNRINAQFDQLNNAGQEFSASFDSAALRDFQSGILDIAREVGDAADEIAGVASSFLGAFTEEGPEAALRATEIATQIAAVAQLSTGEIFNDLIAGAQSFANEGQSVNSILQEIGDSTIAVRNITGVAGKDLVDFTGRVAPIAEQAGASLQEVQAIGATLLQASGVDGAALAEQFGRVLSTFSESAGPELARLSVETEGLNLSLQDIEEGNAVQVIIDLAEQFGNLTEAQQRQVIADIGSRREGAAVAALLQNRARLMRILNETTDVQGSLDAEFAKRQESVAFQLAQTGAAFEEFGIKLFESGLGDFIIELADTFEFFADLLTSTVIPTLEFIADIVNELPDGFAETAVKVGVLVGALNLLGRTQAGSALATRLGAATSVSAIGAGIQSRLPGAGLRANRALAAQTLGNTADSVASLYTDQANRSFRQAFAPSAIRAKVAGIGPFGIIAGGLIVDGIIDSIVDGATEEARAAASARFDLIGERIAEAGGISQAPRTDVNEILNTALGRIDDPGRSFLENTQQALSDPSALFDQAFDIIGVSGAELSSTLSEAGQARVEAAQEQLIEQFGPQVEEFLRAAVNQNAEALLEIGGSFNEEVVDIINRIAEERNITQSQALQAYLDEGGEIFVQAVDEAGNLRVASYSGEEIEALIAKLESGEFGVGDADFEAFIGILQLLSGFLGETSGTVQDFLAEVDRQFGGGLFDTGGFQVGEIDVSDLPAPEQGDVARETVESLKAQFEAGQASLDSFIEGLDNQIDIIREIGDADPNFARNLEQALNLRNETLSEAARSSFDFAQELAGFTTLDEGVSTVEARIDALEALLNNPEFTGDSEAASEAALELLELQQQALRLQAEQAESLEETINILRQGREIPENQQVILIRAALSEEGNEFRRFLEQYVFAGQVLTEAAIADIAQKIADLGSASAALEEIVRQRAAVLFQEADDLLRGGDDQAALEASREARRLLEGTFLDESVPGETTIVNPPDFELPTTVFDNDAYVDALEEQADQAEKAREESANLAREIQDAQFELLLALYGGDPVRAAQIAQDQARAAYARAENEAERLRAEAQRVRADRQLEEAIRDIAAAQIELAIAYAEYAGDTVEVAQLGLEQAQERFRQIQQDFQNGQAGQADVLRAEADVVRAQAQARDEQLNSQLSEYQFLYDMEQITKEQFIAYLQSLKQIPDLTTEQIRDIDRQIKSLRDELASDLQFNLPTTFRLPTLYEVRRTDQGTGGGIGYQDNRQVNAVFYITNGMTANQAQAFLEEVVGGPVKVTDRRY